MADVEENMDSDEKVGSDVSFTIVDEFVCSDSSNESQPGTPVIPSFDDILSTIDSSLPKENRSLNDFGPTAGFKLHPENHKNDKMSDDLMDPNHDSDEKNNKSPDNCSFVDNNADISLHPASNKCSLVSELICNEILVEDNIGSVASNESILQTDNNMINPVSQKSDNFASLESDIDPLSEPSPIYDSVNEISEIVRKSPPFMSSDVFPNSEKNSAMNFDASFCDMPLKTIFSGDESSEHSDASGSNKLETSHSMPKYQLNNETDKSNRAISNKNYLNINVKPCKLVIKRLTCEEIKNYNPILKSKLTHEIPVLKFNRKSRLLKSKHHGIKSHELELHNSLTSSVTQKRLKEDLPDISSFDSISSLESLSALYETDDKTSANPHLLIKNCKVKLYRCDEPKSLRKKSAKTKNMKSASHRSIEKHNIVMKEVTESASCLPLRHRDRPKIIERISSSTNLKEQKKKIPEDEEVSLKMKEIVKPVDCQSINRRGRPKKLEIVTPSEKNNEQTKKIPNCDEDNLQVKEVTESSYPCGAPKKTEAMSSSKKKDIKLIKKNVDREEDSLMVNEISESINFLHVRRRGRPKKVEEISSFTKNQRESKKLIDKKADTVIMNGVTENNDSSHARFHGRSKRVRKISSSSDEEEHVKDKACKKENFSFKIKPCKVMILRNPALNEFLKSKKDIDLVGESSLEKEQSKVTSSPQKLTLKSKKDRSKVKFDEKMSITKHIQGNKISKKNERQEFSYLSIKPCRVLLTRVNIEQCHTNSTKKDNSNSLVSTKRKKSQGNESYSEESDVDIISEKLPKKNNRQEISKNLDDSDHQKRNKQENRRKREIIPKSTTEKSTSLKRENESSTSKRGRKRKKLELSDSHTNEKILNTCTIDTDSENILEIEKNEESSEKSRSKHGRKKKVQYSECTENQINCVSELSTDITEKIPESSKIVDKDNEEKNSSEVLNKSLTDESRSSKRGRKKKEVQFSERTKDQINCGSDLSTDKIPGSSKIVDKDSEENNSSEVLSKSLKKESISSKLGRKKKKIQFSECTEDQISCGSELTTDKTPESTKIVDKDSDEKNSELLSKSLTEESRSSKRGRKKKIELSECTKDQINCSSEVIIDITDKTPRSSKVVDKDSEEKNSSEVLSKSLTNESRSSKHSRKKMRQVNSNNEDENNLSISEQRKETIEQRLQNKTPCEKSKAKTLNNSTKSLKSTTDSNLVDEEEEYPKNLSDREKEKESESEQNNECVSEEVKSKQISDASCEKNQSPSAENSNDDAEKSNPNMDEGSNLSFSSLGNDEMTSKNRREEIEEKKQKLVSGDEDRRIQEIYDINIRGENEQELSYNSEKVEKSDSDQCNTAINENLNNQENNHFAETITKNCNENIELPKLLSDSEDGIFDKEQCNKTIDVESECDQVSEKTIAECDTLKETRENSQILHLQEPNSASVQKKISQILSDSDQEQCKENDKLKSSKNDVTMETEKQTRFSPKPVECPTTEDFFKMPDPSDTVSDEMKVSVDSDENQKSGLDLQSEIENIKSSENVKSSGLTDGTNEVGI